MRGSRFLLIIALVVGIPARSGASVHDQPDLLERLQAAEARINELEMARLPNESETGNSQSEGPQWNALYDSGFRIKPVDKDANPFELRINGRMQFRHVGFARDVTTWTDNAGVVRPVTNRNDFEIERGRLEFRGTFLDPKLQFFLNLDADTDDNHEVIFHDFWVNYEFCDALDVYIGKAFVPGSRDWLNGSTRTRLVDRSMATTFFRPDRTVGIWAIGEPVEGVFYRFMVGNGFNTTDLAPSEVDTRFVYSGSMWMNLGDYGQGYSDLQWHCDPAAQVGHSFTAAQSGGRDTAGTTLAEMNFVRLSDGTRLTQLGALAPGVTVDHFVIYLYTVDAAFKWRGFSANGEYFFRWLQSISGNGPLPISRMYDHGYYAEAGYFLIPYRFEINARVSEIFGAFGDSQEYAAGFNWFINGTHGWKFSFDVTKLNNCPAQNSGPNLRAGDDGLLFRTQLQAAF